MKRRHHTPEQIVRKLREADRMLGEGTALVEVCKHLDQPEGVRSLPLLALSPRAWAAGSHLQTSKALCSSGPSCEAS